MTPSDRTRRSWETRHASRLARFWDRVDQTSGPDGCWPYTGKRDRKGYGTLGVSGRATRAHRLALQLTLGRPIASGLQALHHCDNPPCCNPAHLYEGTPADNMRDAWERGRQRGLAKAGTHKLRPDEVRYIRASAEKRSDLAARFRTGVDTITRVRSRRTYADVA